MGADYFFEGKEEPVLTHEDMDEMGWEEQDRDLTYAYDNGRRGFFFLDQVGYGYGSGYDNGYGRGGYGSGYGYGSCYGYNDGYSNGYGYGSGYGGYGYGNNGYG